MQILNFSFTGTAHKMSLNHLFLARVYTKTLICMLQIKSNKTDTFNDPLLCFNFPQLTNLTQHFEKATEDILTAIPDPDFSGLAVIDWEKWFPQWDFPSTVMIPHRKASVDLVRQRHPDWDNETLNLVAKLEFEQSAKALMEGTLLLGQRLV